MVPFFKNSYWNSIFFISFLVFGYYLFYPIMLAITFDSYKETKKKEKNKNNTVKIDCLTKAFEQMDVRKKGKVNYKSFILLLSQLSLYSDIPYVKPKNYKHFFFYLTNHKNFASLDDFLNITRHLKKEFFSKREPNTHKIFPSFFRSDFGRAFVDFVTGPLYE